MSPHSMKASEQSCQSGSDPITAEQRMDCKMIFRDAPSALKGGLETEIPVHLSHGPPSITTSKRS